MDCESKGQMHWDISSEEERCGYIDAIHKYIDIDIGI